MKTIGKQLRYVKKVQISEFDKDNIEPICWLNIFADNQNNLFGFKEYDYRMNQPLKSDSWTIGYKYHLKFVTKDVEKHLNEDTTIIQRLKEF
tara:strand:- start:210 stop:485 length:276 start_codon:yes stop_codon:yes gene_type:complete